MRNKLFLFVGLICIALAGCTKSTPVKEHSEPNIILIYLDDMGYGDLSLTGAIDYTTPNLDKMASQGIFFSRYYAPQAVCTASRAGILTGCYPNRIGLSGAIDHSSKIGISSNEETIANVLKKKGYSTAAFGKWHLGWQKQFLPVNHGFDEFLGIPYSHDMYPGHPTHKNYYPPLPLIKGDSVITTSPDFSEFTTLFTEKTVEFIEKHKSDPFFIYLAHPLPHVPLAVSDKFKGKSKQGLYGDVMMEIDWSVGQILTTLEKLNLEENTLVIFASDNGPWINYGNHAGSTGGLREGKGTSFEGGQRVPCLMYWKNHTPAGTVCNKLISGIDILPTLASISGAALPSNQIDGVDISSLISGDITTTPRKYFYYYYQKNSLEAVTNGSWKLIFPHPGRTYAGFAPGKDGMPGKVNGYFDFEGGLYDLRRDPGERYNLASENPEIVKELEKIAMQAREDLGDDLTDAPGKNRRSPGRVSE